MLFLLQDLYESFDSFKLLLMSTLVVSWEEEQKKPANKLKLFELVGKLNWEEIQPSSKMLHFMITIEQHPERSFLVFSGWYVYGILSQFLNSYSFLFRSSACLIGAKYAEQLKFQQHVGDRRIHLLTGADKDRLQVLKDIRAGPCITFASYGVASSSLNLQTFSGEYFLDHHWNPQVCVAARISFTPSFKNCTFNQYLYHC